MKPEFCTYPRAPSANPGAPHLSFTSPARLPGSPLQSAHPTTRIAWRALFHGIADVIRPERPQLAHAIRSTSGLPNQVAKDDAPSRGIVGVLAVFWRSNTSLTQEGLNRTLSLSL